MAGADSGRRSDYNGSRRAPGDLLVSLGAPMTCRHGWPSRIICEHGKDSAIIGAGLIGRAWAMVFARAGWRVRLHDATARNSTPRACSSRRASTSRRATGSSPIRRRRGARSIVATLETRAGADWVQENSRKRVDVKREVFAALDILLLRRPCSRARRRRFPRRSSPRRCAGRRAAWSRIR